MNKHETINYLEIPSSDLAKTQTFFEAVFAWEFESYGPEYLAFKSEAIEGGFFKSKLVSRASNGSVLIVFYSAKLEESLDKVVANGGVISESIFSFPGGRRFHFHDPVGNEFAVWSE